MKTIKNKIPFLILLIGIFSFTSEPKETTSINLNDIDVVKALTQETFQCRPSSKIMFYVETDLIKKYRGYNSVNANVYILDRNSGNRKLIASENIIIPFSEDVVLNLEELNDNIEKTKLENGDYTFGSTKKTPYQFKDLIAYQSIYNSYINASNKLLGMQRNIL